MLDHETHVKIADELHRAGVDRHLVPLLTARYPEMEIEDSYAVQRIWAERQVEAGRTKVGHKIGLISKAMQDAVGIDELRGPGLNLLDVLRATEYVVPALEVLDSRIEMQGRTITDTISDNAALGSMVLGRRPVGVGDVDLRWVAGMLSRNHEIIEAGVAAGVLNHPGNGVHWLANRIAGHGDVLEAGEIILAGSFARPMWVYAGDGE